MNVFIIPSWYPSPTHPLAGIFFQEQARYLAESDPGLRVAVSLWGQEDENLFLAKKDFPHYFPKLRYYHRLRPYRKALQENLVEYYAPVLQWNRRLLGGNFRAMLQVNARHLRQFEQEAGKVDAIHAHVAYPAGYLALHLSQQFKVPFVVTEHMGPFPFRSFLKPDEGLVEEVRRPLEAAHRTIAVSPALVSRISSFGLPTPLYIPNVVDEAFFCPAESEPRPEFTFFALGSMEESKGMADLLQAFRLALERRGSSLHLRIGGDGSQWEAYQALTERLGLGKHVTWLGPLTREQARAEHQQADAFVLPSHGESFGVVFAEAIACGKPVVATRCGGPESIVNATNGLLAAVGEVEDIAQKMLALVDRRHLYDPHAIRADFLNRFSKQVVIPQLVGVYAGVGHPFSLKQK